MWRKDAEKECVKENDMKNIFLFSIIAIISGSVFSQAVGPCAVKEYTDIWPSVDSMPNKQKHQIAVRERQKPPAGRLQASAADPPHDSRRR